jgi:ataxia telangiectasia mutated family protein
MALSLTNKDKELEGFKVTAANEEERVTAAKSLIKNLTRRKEVGPQCQKLEQLSNELIKLANKDVKMYKGNKDKHAELFDFKKWESENLKTPPELVKPRGGWEDVAVPTVTIPLRPDSNYSRYFIGIVSFSDTFELVGGINAPKKLTCRGIDGVSRPMLLKGKDDLRQDVRFSILSFFLHTF